MVDRPLTDAQQAEAAEWVELFRKALMREHAHDWTMDAISEAAHICAREAVDPGGNGPADTAESSQAPSTNADTM